MTIFLIVLKELLKDKLDALIKSLKEKAQAYGYDHELSTQLYLKIEDYLKQVMEFKGTGHDENDHQAIIKLMNDAREKVMEIRAKHKKQQANGETVKCLEDSEFCIKDFYKSLSQFKFPLLNISCNEESPDGVVYFHSACYLGQEAFNPKKSIDVSVWAKKREALSDRLFTLSDLCRQNSGFSYRAKQAKKIIEDLLSDNKKIVENCQPSGALVSVVSIFSFNGVGFSGLNKYLGPSEGRFKEQFDRADRKIEELKTKYEGKPQGNTVTKPSAVVNEPLSEEVNEPELVDHQDSLLAHQ